MTQFNFLERLSNWFKDSLSVKLFAIGIIILVLLIPVNMVNKLIEERKHRQYSAMVEVSSKWGGPQEIIGLVLTVPYYTYKKVYEGNDQYRLEESMHYAHFLPENIDIDGEILPEIRHRGIYDVIVYRSKLQLKGKFKFPKFTDWKIPEKDIIWDEAFVSLGISDLRGIQEGVILNFIGEEYTFNPGIESNEVIKTGISSRVNLPHADSLKHDLSFALDLALNGSSNINFVPVGKSTNVSIHSKWTSPSFDGAFLPDNYEITNDSFTANWNVIHLNRPYPQSFRGSTQGIKESAFGVKLIVPVDEYQQSMRAAKYASLFIVLTFLIFFFIQILNKVRVHSIQYIIVGLALCVFYILLIAISEHVSFMISYIISSISIIGMITFYAHSIFKNSGLTRLIGVTLTALYSFIYIIIQSVDYALIMGSLGLFIVLAVVMYLSRKIDWYAINSKPSE